MPVIPVGAFGVFLLVIVSGFVAASVIAHGLRLLTPDGAAGLLGSDSRARQFAGIFAFVLAGPSLVFEGMLRPGQDRVSWMMAGIAVSALWSYVNGLFLVLCLLVLMR